MALIASIIILASVISGETGNICPVEAKIAIAHIYSRNQIFYGLDSNFSALDLYISMNWQKMRDTSHGAQFIFSDADLEQERVQKLISGRKLKAQFECRGGLNLYAY